MNFYLQFFCFYPKYLVFNVSRETYKIIPRCKFNGGYFYKYKGSFPACLFKYDIESDTVLYAGYLMRDGMEGIFQIERTDQE